MREIQAVVCDDEAAWRNEANRVLESYAQEAGIELSLATYASAAELEAADGPAPDVLFCDIELAGEESGIDLVRALAARWPLCQIVYVTNYLRYAPEVYVTEHLWFVLKDRFEERLPEVMDKLARKMDDDGRVLVVRTTLRESLTVPSPHLVMLERRGRVTILRCDDGSSFEVRDRLPALLEHLPERSFARCHASFAVNLGHVRLLRRDSLQMDDGTEAPLSRRFAHGFRSRYLDWADDHAL